MNESPGNGASAEDVACGAPETSHARAASIWREPLLHFLLIGLVLLAVDRLANPGDGDDRVVLVDAKVQAMLVAKFVEGRGREPSAEEYEELVRLWAKNEIMYREALALGLDKGDEMIRSRLVLKMRDLVYGNITVRGPDPGELQAWLAAHRERYDEPRRFAFEQVALADGADAAALLAAARAAGSLPDTLTPRVRRYTWRSRDAIAAVFGDAFADGLAAAAPREWVLLQSADGAHLARVTAVREAEPATLASHRGRVEADWRETQAKLSVRDQLAAIRARYEVRREDGAAGAEARAGEEAPGTVAEPRARPASASRG